MAFDQNITENSTNYDVWKTIVHDALLRPIVYYYKFKIFKGSTTGFYSDDYMDDYDNLNKDGTGAASDGEPFNSFQITAYDPNFQTPAWMANANVYQIFPDRFRNGDPTNDYCVPGSPPAALRFMASSSLTSRTPPGTRDVRSRAIPAFRCYNNFGSIFYGGDLLGIQNGTGLHPGARHSTPSI